MFCSSIHGIGKVVDLIEVNMWKLHIEMVIDPLLLFSTVDGSFIFITSQENEQHGLINVKEILTTPCVKDLL